MKKTLDNFMENFKKNVYYTGPEKKDSKEVRPSEDKEKELKRLQKENEALKGDAHKLAFDKFKTRRSIRKFSGRKVDWKIIFEIISGSLNAPAAGGVENTDILIIQDKEMKSEVGKIENQQYWLADAPYLIVVVRCESRLCSLYPQMGELYAIQNTAAVIENILMMAHFYDLGACWVQSCDSDVLKETLGVPHDKSIDAVIPIGFPIESPEVTRAHESAKLHFEKYGNRKRPSLM